MHKVAGQKNKKGEQQIKNKQAIPMLSQLFIQLPKPNTSRKKSALCQQDAFNTEYLIQTPNNDRYYQKNCHDPNNNRKEVTPSNSKSSQYLESNRKDKDIILGWIRSIFQKKNLLGLHWQQKIQDKRASMIKSAFQRLKEERQSVYSPYLQTQSKHKPHFNKQNHIILMGLEKFNEAVYSISMKAKRAVFSKILRYLAFQNTSSKPNSKLDSITLQLQSTGPLSSRNQGREDKLVQQASPKNANLVKPVLAKEITTPKKLAKINDYNIAETQFKTPIKQVQSSKNLIFSANQYALSPASPIKQQLTDKKIPKRESKLIVMESRMSKNSESKLNRELVNSKSQPHQLAIGGIGGNFKYQFNQHNYIVVQPENIQQIPHQLPAVNPPSPLSHQFMPSIKFHTPQIKQINFQQTPLVLKQSRQMRDANYVRPHSHNPFLTPSSQTKISNNQLIVEDRTEVRKSRSISATGNIKISFMSKQEMNARQINNKRNDYQQEERIRLQEIHKLGSAENRKMRQHYQYNSYGNQLIPQDYIPTPLTPTPNYIYSSPISPRPLEIHSPSIHVNYISPNPQSPVARSPRGFGYQSYFPTNQQPREVPQQMKQSIQISSSDSKRLLRQKILVTSSQKQKGM